MLRVFLQTTSDEVKLHFHTWRQRPHIAALNKHKGQDSSVFIFCNGKNKSNRISCHSFVSLYTEEREAYKIMSSGNFYQYYVTYQIYFI